MKYTLTFSIFKIYYIPNLSIFCYWFSHLIGVKQWGSVSIFEMMNGVLLQMIGFKLHFLWIFVSISCLIRRNDNLIIVFEGVLPFKLLLLSQTKSQTQTRVVIHRSQGSFCGISVFFLKKFPWVVDRNISGVLMFQLLRSSKWDGTN